MRVAIVEDELEAVETLKGHFDRYTKEKNCAFTLSTYGNAMDFLEAYRPDYDLVLLDIKMPMMDGMSGAKRLRAIDPYVPIVFITSMACYAVEGYSVNALDFIVKPVGYFSFERMLDRVCRALAAAEDRHISVLSAGVTRCLPASHIKYVEVYRKKLTFHTLDGNIDSWGSISMVADQLPQDAFSKCNNCYLINLKYVDCIEKNEVVIGEERLPISHLRKKDFMQALSLYLGRRR